MPTPPLSPLVPAAALGISPAPVEPHTHSNRQHDNQPHKVTSFRHVNTPWQQTARQPTTHKVTSFRHVNTPWQQTARQPTTHKVTFRHVNTPWQQPNQSKIVFRNTFSGACEVVTDLCQSTLEVRELVTRLNQLCRQTVLLGNPRRSPSNTNTGTTNNIAPTTVVYTPCRYGFGTLLL